MYELEEFHSVHASRSNQSNLNLSSLLKDDFFYQDIPYCIVSSIFHWDLFTLLDTDKYSQWKIIQIWSGDVSRRFISKNSNWYLFNAGTQSWKINCILVVDWNSVWLQMIYSANRTKRREWIVFYAYPSQFAQSQ